MRSFCETRRKVTDLLVHTRPVVITHTYCLIFVKLCKKGTSVGAAPVLILTDACHRKCQSGDSTQLLTLQLFKPTRRNPLDPCNGTRHQALMVLVQNAARSVRLLCLGTPLFRCFYQFFFSSSVFILCRSFCFPPLFLSPRNTGSAESFLRFFSSGDGFFTSVIMGSHPLVAARYNVNRFSSLQICCVWWPRCSSVTVTSSLLASLL
jgi:hypothetical protein